jgi:peptidoglycan/LPS O-acetylase OafA/YrhL
MVFFLPYSIRYRALIEPFLVLLAACAILTAVDRVRAGFAVPAGAAPPPAPAGRARSRPLVAAPDAIAVVDPDQAPATGGGRARNLDSLRAVAALMVLVGHAYNLSGDYVPLVARDLGDIGLNLLVAGVWLFFSISGYVISRSFVRAIVAGEDLPSIGGYWIRRLARIFPLYWVALGVALWSVGDQHARIWDLGAHLALLHNLLPGRQQAIIPGAWTLSLELGFYLLVPVAAVLVVRRRKGRPFPAGELAGWVVTAWVASILWTVGADLVGNTANGLWLRQLLPSMLAMFFPGVLLAVAELAPAGTRLHAALAAVDRRRALLWVAAFALVTVAAMGAYLDPDDGITRYLLLYDAARIPFALGFGLMVVLARRAPEWTGVTGRALGTIGDWSYGVYLLQGVWFYALFERHPNLIPLTRQGVGPYLVHVALLTALTLPVSWLAHERLEKPIMRKGAELARRWNPGAWPAARDAAEADMRQAQPVS